MTARARLLKVVVQPVFVMDDGDGLEEVSGQPIEVPGRDWRTFGASAFGEGDLASVAEQYAASQEQETDPAVTTA